MMARAVLIGLIMCLAGVIHAQGQSLDVLSAYYMPDQKPPVDSHATEGDLKDSIFGKIFAPMQTLHKRHAEFGGREDWIERVEAGTTMPPGVNHG
jgi:hypothetical protein